MSASSFQNTLILKGHRDLIPVFEELGIRDQNGLSNLKDSHLRRQGYNDAQRLHILKAANHILDMFLPFTDEIVYAFDVDGTLTPHPGQSPISLWHRGDDYYFSLSEEQRDAMVRMLSVLPDRLILISRNEEANVMDLLRSLNTEFVSHIDMNYSAFRSSGLFPTEESKANALKHLANLHRPVFYVDDSEGEISRCNILSGLNQYLGCYHAKNWIGDAGEFTNMANMAIQFYQQVSHI